MRRYAPLVVLLILALTAAPPSVAARRPPVIVVVFDEFPVDSLLRPDGRIDAARYPGFGRLANRATWFPNAFSAQDRTGAALPAILDGRLPRRGARPTAADHPRNLFTLLAGHGYRVQTSEPVSALCPRAICPDPIVQSPGPPNPLFLSQRVTRFRRALRSLRRTRRPLLLFHHQILPHQPWERLPSGRRYRTDPGSWDRGLSSGLGFHDAFLSKQSQQRHLLQVGFVDREIGQLLDRLEQVGLARRALLVVTADHGMGFDVGVLDRRTISEGNIDEIAPVPLFVKAPGQLRGSVDRTYVHTVDVVPTIAGLLRLRRLWPMEGRSAFERRGAHQVRVPRFDLSGSVTIAPGPLERARAANRREKARLFGTGAESLYRIGPNRSLLGQLVADLDVEPGAVKTRGFTSRFQFRPSTNFAPTWFTGQLVIGRAPEGKRDLALALNGRVVAVGRSFRLRGERTDRFSLLAPESGLAPSVNRAALFAVRGGRLLRLEPAG